jgi:hypothetical protein
MMTEKQWMLLGMRRISCFVIIIINNNIIERLVGNLMATLVKGEEVVLVVLNHSSKVDQTPTPSSFTLDSENLSKEELEILCWLMSQLAPATTVSSSAHLGNLASSLNATLTCNIGN